MAPSDLDQLIEMGFDKERAELAVTKSGGRRCSDILPLVVLWVFTNNKLFFLSPGCFGMARSESRQIFRGDKG